MSLESELLSFLNQNSSEYIGKDELYDYKAIFLNKIVADSSNPRFLPSVIISNNHAYQFVSRQLTRKQLVNIYNAENKVLIGKSCIVNCLKYGSPEWKNARETIESIVELAENIAVSEIIQAPTIYPIDNGIYQIMTGHRRFFAMLYNDGIDGVSHFKVYNSKPPLLKIKQFQENTNREDLPQYGKLKAFQDASREIETLNTSKKKLGQKTLTVRESVNLLGISMGAYDNYNVLTRYPATIDFFEKGNSDSFLSIKKLILRTEKAYKKKNNTSKLNAHDRSEINKKIESYLNPKAKSAALQKNTPTTSKKSTIYKVGNIESPFVIEKLLKSNICEIDCGINWGSINWQDPSDLNRALKTLIKYLSENDPANKSDDE